MVQARNGGAVRLTAGQRKAEPDRTLAEDGRDVDLSVLANTAGFMIRIAQLLLFQAFYDQFKTRGLSTGIYSALVIIGANPGIKQGALGYAMLVKRPNMTKLVGNLVERDLVERKIAPSDRRAISLFLTAKGKTLLAQVQDEATRYDAHATRALSAKERQTLLQLVDKLVRNLRAPDVGCDSFSRPNSGLPEFDN